MMIFDRYKITNDSLMAGPANRGLGCSRFLAPWLLVQQPIIGPANPNFSITAPELPDARLKRELEVW